MKFINKLINFINEKFKLDIKDKERKEKELNEIRVMLSNLKSGDMIWARRFSSKEEENNIPMGHREGPFIIVSNNKDGIYATKGTSVEPIEENYDTYFKIDRQKYNLHKETYFKINSFKKIDENSFIRLMCHLKDDDEFDFYKKLKKIYHQVIMQINKDIINLPLQIGDVVIYDNKHYVIVNIKHDDLTLLSIENVRLKGKLEKEQLNKIDYSKTIVVNKNEIKYRGSVSDKVLDRITNKYNEHLKHVDKEKNIQRGSLILKDRNIYYIFGEEGQEWMAFELKKNYLIKYQTLKVNKQTYFTSFEEVRLNKKDNYEIICLCKDEDIDKIKIQRKKYKENKKLQEQFNNTKNLRFNIGNIIESRFYKNKSFIIIRVCPKTYECLSLQKIKLGIFDPVLLKKEDTKLSKNSSLEGIKWFEKNPNFNINQIGNEKILDEIFETQKQYLDSNEEKNIIDRGSIISKDHKYYYIYGKEGQNFMVFEIFNKYIDTFELIKINGSTYYTEFNELLLNMKDDYNFVMNANEEEIEIIKKNKKRYKEINKSIEPQKDDSEIKIGSTIKRDNDSDEEFVVSSIIGNVLVCTSRVDKGYSKTKKHYINKEGIILVKNK